MTTKEIITRDFDTVNKHDWESWYTLFDDDIVFDDAITGPIKGIEAMKASVVGTSEGFDKFENIAEEIVAEGNKGMAVCHIKAVTKNGKTLDSTGANFFRIENGKIVYLSSFHDREPFIKAFS